MKRFVERFDLSLVERVPLALFYRDGFVVDRHY
jgi:hypothetical protein